MKIALAQLKSESGNVEANIKKHLDFITKAAKAEAKLIVFPELSLTNYEPGLAKDLAFEENDPKLDIFKKYSTKYNINIALGLPLKLEDQLHIAMAIFKSKSELQFYCKQYLHEDEVPFFQPKKNASIIQFQQKKVKLAICYEISVDEHLENLNSEKPDLFIASVAKHKKGMKNAQNRLQFISENYKITTLLVNNTGLADGMNCCGNSFGFNASAKKIAQLNTEESLLIINAE